MNAETGNHGKGLSRRLLHASPALVRALRIAGTAYRAVPVGERLAVALQPHGDRGHAALVISDGAGVVVVERFSDPATAEAFRAAVEGCLERWRRRRRPHASLPLKMLVPHPGLCYHRSQP